jgi:hypothetical protein
VSVIALTTTDGLSFADVQLGTLLSFDAPCQTTKASTLVLMSNPGTERISTTALFDDTGVVKIEPRTTRVEFPFVAVSEVA